MMMCYSTLKLNECLATIFGLKSIHSSCTYDMHTSLGAPEEWRDRLGSWGESTERGVPGAGRLVGTFWGKVWVRSGGGCKRKLCHTPTFLALSVQVNKCIWKIENDSIVYLVLYKSIYAMQFS